MNLIICTGIGACLIAPAIGLEWLILNRYDAWQRRGKPPKPAKEPTLIQGLVVFVLLIAVASYLIWASHALGCWVVHLWMKH